MSLLTENYIVLQHIGMIFQRHYMTTRIEKMTRPPFSCKGLTLEDNSSCH